MAKDYCEKKGLVLSEKSFRDRGISAWKGKNRANALGELLQTLKPGNTLLIEDNDRLSREDPLTAMNLLHSIVAKGVFVVTLRDGCTISKANFFDLSTFLPNIVKGALANQENEKKSFRLKESWNARRSEMRQGKHRSGKLPFWVKKVDNKLVLISDKADIVRKIFELSMNGRGIHAILHYLVKNKIPPSGYCKKWVNSSLQRLLRSTSVFGVFQPMTHEGGKKRPIGEPIVDYYPAAISKETFLVVQGKIDKRKNTFKGPCNPERVTNLVSGIAKCSKCGSAMVVTDKARKRYLYCNQMQHNANCVSGGILYEVFEVILLECLQERLEVSGFFGNESNTKALQFKIDAKIQQLKETDLKLSKLADIVLESDAPQVLVQKMKAMEVKQVATRKEIEQLQATLLEAQRLPASYRQLMAEIDKWLQQDMRQNVTVEMNPTGKEPDWGTGPYRSTKVVYPRSYLTKVRQELKQQLGSELPADRFLLREGLRSMIKKMIVDIPTKTIVTTWPNDNTTTIQIKRENHGISGNTWFYRSVNNNDAMGDWKQLEQHLLGLSEPKGKQQTIPANHQNRAS